MTIPFTDIDRRYGLPEGTLSAVWTAESARGTNRGPSRNAQGRVVGAMGHFQFMPATGAEISRRSGHDPFSDDPREAAQAAGFYLGELYRNNDRDLNRALAAYNWGQGNLNRQGMGNAPSETRNYIAKITRELGMPARQEFTERYEAGETSEREREREAEVRRRTARRVGVPEEEIERLSQPENEPELLGSAFLMLIMAVVADMVVKQQEEGRVPSLPPVTPETDTSEAAVTRGLAERAARNAVPTTQVTQTPEAPAAPVASGGINLAGVLPTTSVIPSGSAPDGSSVSSQVVAAVVRTPAQIAAA